MFLCEDTAWEESAERIAPLPPERGEREACPNPQRSLEVALAAIAIEKIVLAILWRIEECWEPCQEKADEGK